MVRHEKAKLENWVDILTSLKGKSYSQGMTGSTPALVSRLLIASTCVASSAAMLSRAG